MSNMPDIIVQFTGQELDEMLALAATRAVGKEGYSANGNDVIYEVTSPGSPPWRAKVIVRNTSQR